MKRTAEKSECGKYRWWLQRRWADGPIVSFVMLNPSTADGTQDDPTIRRCIAFAQAWGFGALDVRNLYPYRATDPKDLLKAMRTIDVTGGERGDAELRAAMTGDLVIAAWGTKATKVRVERFIALTDPRPLHCIVLTKHGHPAHPLFQAADLKPIPFRRCHGGSHENLSL